MVDFVLVLLVLCSTICASVNGQHDLNQLPARSVIAQMFEWRFKDIADECEQWLGPKGYGAVQVCQNPYNIYFDIVFPYLFI